MKLKTLSLAALLAVAGPSWADSVLLEAFSFKPPTRVTTVDLSDPANDRTDFRTGQLRGLLNGHDFVTYCTDLAQDIRFGVAYADFFVVPGEVAWGPDKARDLGRVMTAALMSGLPTSAPQSAAVQAAIWEVIYEQPGNPYHLGAGTFKVTSADGPTQQYMDMIPWGEITQVPVQYRVDKLEHREIQDLLLVNQVPEPGTLMMLVAGLVGIGTVVRRRSADA
jgi:hypothetical protein